MKKTSFTYLFLACLAVALAILACNLPGQTAPTTAPIQPPTAEAPAATLQPTAAPTSPPTEPPPQPTQPLAPSNTAPAPTSAATDTPAPRITSTRVNPQSIPQAVAMVTAGDMLNIRRAPSPSAPLLAQLPPDGHGFVRTGNQQLVGNQRWVELRLPSGEIGWANNTYLTEYVSPENFCKDPQVQQLLQEFTNSVTSADGSLLASLISPTHGLNVNVLHSGNRITYTPDQALFAYESSEPANWGVQPGSGLPLNAAFRDAVLPDLLKVLQSDHQAVCNEIKLGGASYQYTWPVEYSNFGYYSLYKPGTPGQENDWRTWLVGVEYSGGRPFLVSLTQLFWEP